MKKKIPEYSRYEIDSNGRVYDTHTGKTQPTVWNGGFLCTNLIRDDGVKVLCKIHRLVAITFVENPHNANRVVHKDGDRSNNSIENIVWQPKKVKEVSVKDEPTYEYCGQMLTLDEIAALCVSDETTIKRRLKAGWSVVECKVGSRNFTGCGVQSDSHWFPSVKEMADFQASLRKKEREQVRMNLLAKKEGERLARVQNMYCGVGINDAPETEGYIRAKWMGMLHRCYNKKFHEKCPTYSDCIVTEDWKSLSKFAEWCRVHYIKGWHLDKDILLPGNKCYGPQYSAFIPAYINSLLWDSTTKTSHLHGVSKDGGCERYKIKVGRLGEVIILTGFSDELSAHLKWQEEKIVSILCSIDKYRSEPVWRQDIVDALMVRVYYLQDCHTQGKIVEYLV